MDIPLDVQKIIIRHLDIDTRRSLNIYTTLKIPEQLKQSISNSMIIYSDLINISKKTISIKMNDSDTDLIDIICNNIKDSKTIEHKKMLYIAHKLLTLESSGSVAIYISKNKNNINIWYYHTKNVIWPLNELTLNLYNI